MMVTRDFRCGALLRAFLVLFAAVPMVLGLSSCGATTRKYPVTEVVQAANERVFWNSLRLAISEEDFLVGGVGANPAERSITSGWKVDVVPFGRMRGSENYRARVVATYEPVRDMGLLPKGVERPKTVDPDKEAFLVTLRVEKEHNKSLRPMVARHAKWVGADDDKTWAERLMFMLRSNTEDKQFELTEDRKDGPPFDIE